MNNPAAAALLETETALPQPKRYEIAEHLVAFPDEPWAFWRWAGLRGAGFPAHLVRKLALPASAIAADKLLSAEAEAAKSKEETMETFRLALDQAIDADKEARKLLLRALTQLNKGKVPDLAGDQFEKICRKLASDYAHLDTAKKSFEEQFSNGVLAVSKEIHEIAREPHFRQAVLLQNSTAFRIVLRSFLSSSALEPKRGKKDRQNEELVASYLQRYCLKNDTIGFFGPVGWARLGTEVNDIDVSPGRSLIATASIYFENWCIEALAEKIAANPAVRRWIAPRRLPAFYFDGDMLYPPGCPPTKLPPSQQAILRLCDGELTAKQIATALLGSCGINNEDEVYRLLEDLTKQKILSWAFDLPLVLHPDELFRQLLNRIEEDALRLPAIEALDKLVQARNNVATAFGNADQLDLAITELEKVFEEVTGASCSRSGGEMYASRTLIYQDCRRDLDIEIGPAVLEPLGTPLSLLMTSARWFSYRSAAVCREAFTQAHAAMAQNSPDGTVELLPFWKHAQALLFDPAKNIFNPIVEELQDHWKRILGPVPAERHVQYKSSNLKPIVDDLFSAPGPGWQLARYHSPDVMIAASSVEAIRRGDCLFVLGEAHITQNTLRGSFFIAQHPCPEELFRAMASDLPTPRPVIMIPRKWPRVTNRTSVGLASPYDYYIEVSRDSIYSGARSQTIPASAFVVENAGDGIVIRTRDRRMEFGAVEFFGGLLSLASLVSFDFMRVLNSASHNPRITIDRLVIARESWRFSAKELEFIHEEDEHMRYLQARRWMHRHALPRFVFFKVPVEVKPFYVDFESPIYVEILVKMIRRMLASEKAEESVFVSEMLPGPDELWLPDAEGNAYTNELRMVVRDLAI